MPEYRYKSIDDLNLAGRAYELYLLTQAAPNIVAEVLERLFRDIDVEQLENFGAGRRYIVHSLEYMLKFNTTFWIAARILLKLATAENESYGNNATGIWANSFSIFSTNSPIPAVERMILIREALDSSNWKTRIVGIKGLEILLIGTPQSVGLKLEGYIAPPQWRPKVWGEVYELHKQSLNLLENSLEDTVEEVKNEARKVLLDVAPQQIYRWEEVVLNVLNKIEQLGDKPSRLRGTLQTIIDNNSDNNGDINDNILFEVKNKKNIPKLDGHTISKIESLLSTITQSFSQRLKRWIGELTWKDRQQLYQDNDNEIIGHLVDEAISNPHLLEKEIKWLHSNEAVNSYQFFRLLGEKDTDRYWFGFIREAGTKDPDSKFNPLIGYMVGLYENGHNEWVESIFEDWFEKKELAIGIFFILVNVSNADNLVSWLIKLIEGEQLDASIIGHMQVTLKAKTFSTEQVQSLLNFAMNEDSSELTINGLDLLSGWLETHKEQSNELLPIALELLGKTISRESAVSYHDRSLYTWKQIAQVYVDEHPIKVAEAVIKTFDCSAIKPMSIHDERIKILQLALVYEPKNVWKIIGNALLDEDKAYCFPSRHYGWDDKQPEMSKLIDRAGNDVVSEWILESGVSAARRIAEFVHVLEVPLPKMVRFLLIEYGSDDQVYKIVHPNYSGFGWSGNLSDHYKSLINIARQWMSDEEPIIREWVQDVVDDLETSYITAKKRDDEDDLYW